MFAYIPARSGSKRIKNKNIKIINGKPIISYVIKNLRKLNFINEVYVSTDSLKIQKIAKKYGAKCNFLRSKKLSDDKSGFIHLINHDLPKYIKLQNKSQRDEMIHSSLLHNNLEVHIHFSARIFSDPLRCILLISY